MWPKMIAALAEIDAALGIPDDGCNSTARTLAEIARLRAELERCEKDAGRYRWLRKDFTGLIVTTERDQAADDDRLFVVCIELSKHLRATDASSVDAAVDAAMSSARIVKTSQHVPAATDADAIRAAAELACGLLWMTAEWRQGKTEAAYQALVEAVGGSGSQGLRESIQAALDAGHEVDAPPGCYWPGE